jgi:dihydrofolate reductase
MVDRDADFFINHQPLTMLISLIAAVARNGVMGRAGGLPWRLPDDLRRFKALTMGKPVIMGRRTYESIGRALPGRLNIVLTRQPGFRADGCAVVATPEDTLRAAGEAGEAIVIGGAEVYRAFLPLATRLYLTEVDADVVGDVRFPAWNPEDWIETSRARHEADAEHAFAFAYRVLERRR